MPLSKEMKPYTPKIALKGVFFFSFNYLWTIPLTQHLLCIKHLSDIKFLDGRTCGLSASSVFSYAKAFNILLILQYSHYFIAVACSWISDALHLHSFINKINYFGVNGLYPYHSSQFFQVTRYRTNSSYIWMCTSYFF